MSRFDALYVPFGRVTPPDRHCFFGYYDKFPWSRNGRHLLSLAVPFIDREPNPDDVAEIGMIDLADGNRWRRVAETRAWNFQQGTMLRWLPGDEDRRILFNRRDGDGADARFVSVVLDVETGSEHVLPHAVYALRPDGRQAVSVPFYRIARTRPGYGYVGVVDPRLDVPAPDDDGVWMLDLETGKSRLVFSLARAAALRPLDSMRGAVHWFNHLQYNPGGSRFIFLHRWGPTGGIRWGTRLLTSDPEGRDIRIVADDGMTSHFDWRDDRTILAWARTKESGDHYYLFDEPTGRAEVVAPDVLTTDGHCSYSPDRRWILTDTYPDKASERVLILFQPETARRIDIGRFYSPPEITGPFRCDLHPRWSRDGRHVCIDSVHEGTRGMYVGDVSGITG